MKNLKKITSYFCVIALLTIILGNVFSFSSYAAVSENQKAVEHSSSWGSYVFDYRFHEKYWTINDATGVPRSTVTDPKYFYSYDNQTFSDLNGKEFITLILNRGLGVIINPDNLQALLSQFFASIIQPDSVSNLFIQGAVYDGNHEFLGYAVNDISGCYYDTSHEGEAITVPDESVENVYQFYKYYCEDNAEIVDYFTFYPPSEMSIFDNYYDSTNLNAAQQTYTSVLNNYSNGFNVYFEDSNNSLKSSFGIYPIKDKIYPLNDIYGLCTNLSQWIPFCTKYQLYNGNHELLYSDLVITKPTSSVSGFYVSYLPHYNSNSSTVKFENPYNVNTGVQSSSSIAVQSIPIGWDSINNKYNLICPVGQPFTIYRNSDTYTNINVNQTYSQDTYYTDSYNNYDSNNDNSISTTRTQISSATTNNTNIYNGASDSYYDYVDNGVVNTENITNNVTNIYNNYYGGSDNPDNPDNPVNPDNPDNLDKTSKYSTYYFSNSFKKF